MTLARQLLYGIVVVFIALLFGIEAIYVDKARHRLEEQLDAHANETATSLALSIGSRMQTLDVALINAIVNPLFDRGHFQSIEIEAVDGGKVFARRLGDHEVALPPWFISLVAFEPPRGQALISVGWRQMGKVVVRVHPQFAYLELWDTAIATLVWLSLLFAAALVAMRAYLGGILRPLRLIEQTAVAIGNREFASIDIEPRARELRQVTQAINSLSSKIRDVIAQETARAERLRREAFEDPMTGQLNRRGFENAVATALAKEAEVHSGALVLFAIGGLEEINRTVGLAKGNEILKELALKSATSDGTLAPLAGRWQGPTFAAFVENAGYAEVMAWADKLCRTFVSGLHALGLPQAVTVCAGVGHFSASDVVLVDLSRLADRALAQASTRGSGAVGARLEADDEKQTDLKTEIEAALAQNRLSLVFQKVASIPDEDILQFEFQCKLTDSRGAAVAAGTFVPVASQHGLLPALDHRVVELALEALARGKNLPRELAVNVALQSVLDEGFQSKLQELLKGRPREAARLVFEMTGASASKSPEATKQFARTLKRLGSRLALDNFEMDRNAVALVHDLMPAYVKLAPVFTREIGERDDARFILESVLRVFQPLEIPVIAQGVEQRSLVAVLTQIGVAGFQGYVLGKPEALGDA